MLQTAADGASVFACCPFTTFLIVSSIAVYVVNLITHRLRENKEASQQQQPSQAGAFSADTRFDRILSGRVIHHRRKPLDHHFSYSIYMVLIDLSQGYQTVFDKFWLWAARRSSWHALATFTRSEYISDAQLHQMVADEFANTNRRDVTFGRTLLLTHFRYFGLKFNPVSYYFVYDKNDALLAMISEVRLKVSNTPWGETCWYTHPAVTNSTKFPGGFTHRVPKKMHVSPFFSMSYMYTVDLTNPLQSADDKGFRVSWEMTAVEGKDNEAHGDARTVSSTGGGSSTATQAKPLNEFTAIMNLQSHPFTQWALVKTLFGFPLMTWKVVLMIYWQAFVLWMRKVPFISHPKYASGAHPHNPGAASSTKSPLHVDAMGSSSSSASTASSSNSNTRRGDNATEGASKRRYPVERVGR